MTKTTVPTAEIIANSSASLVRLAVQAGLTVARYLRDAGVRAQWAAQWGSVLGKKAKALYTAAHGAAPRTVREGKNDVAAYDTAEYLDAALAHYREHPKAGPALTAGYDRVKAAAKQRRDAQGRFVRVLTVVWTRTDGRRVFRTLAACEALTLARTLSYSHRVAAVAVRDAKGRPAYALAA